MSNAMVPMAPGEIADRSYSQDQIKLIRDVYAKGATEDEFRLFIEVAKRKGLDIFQRQIHLVKRYDRKLDRNVCEIQTGIDGYRLMAERTGRYEGQSGPFWCGPDGQWVDVWLSPEPPRAAKIGVWRTNCREPFWAVALYSEYCQTYQDKSSGQSRPNPMWAKMPANQLAKCAEALALRKAFPSEMSGIYTSEEMGQASNVIDVTPINAAPTPAQITPSRPATSDQVDDLIGLCDALYNAGIEDGKILDGIANLTGVTMGSLEAVELAKLTSDQIQRVIDGYGKRLVKLQEANAEKITTAVGEYDPAAVQEID